MEATAQAGGTCVAASGGVVGALGPTAPTVSGQ